MRWLRSPFDIENLPHPHAQLIAFDVGLERLPDAIRSKLAGELSEIYSLSSSPFPPHRSMPRSHRYYLAELPQEHGLTTSIKLNIHETPNLIPGRSLVNIHFERPLRNELLKASMERLFESGDGILRRITLSRNAQQPLKLKTVPISVGLR